MTTTEHTGRKKRADERVRSDVALATLADRVAAAMTPWLLAGDPAPKGAHEELRKLRAQLLKEARLEAEAVTLHAILHARVDAWNARWPGAEVAAPGAIARLPTAIPAWTAESLVHLRAALALRKLFEARCARIGVEPMTPETLAGLALASLVFDSACLAQRDLIAVALWLADPDAPVHAIAALPPWIEIKHRARPARGQRPARPLRTASGRDEVGPYALRRLFLDRRSLDLIRRHDALGGAAAALRAAAAGPDALIRLIRLAVDDKDIRHRLALPRFLRGATLALEARPDGPDHAMAMLAARKLDTWAATPESWWVALGGPQAGPADSAAAFDPGDLTGQAPAIPDARARPVPETAAYLRFHAAVRPGQRQRQDLTTPDVKLTPSALAARLRGLGDPGVDCLRLLRDWYLHLLDVEGLKAQSVQRYHSTVAAAFCAAAGAETLRALPGEDFEELCDLLLTGETRSDSERRHLSGRLRALHGFAMKHPVWDLPEIDGEVFSGSVAGTVVRAVCLARPEIDAARSLLRSGLGLAPDVARAADAAFLLASRAGLRIGEVTKAMLDDMEDVGGDPERLAEAVLLVRPSRFGDNKTRSAHRQIKPFALFTAAEAENFLSWLGHRRHLAATGPLFGVMQPDGSIDPFSTRALGAVIAEALRRASGLDNPSAHTLRRAALTNLFLCLHEFRVNRAQPILDRLTGWTAAERRRAASSLAADPKGRDAWDGLARHAGHGSAEMTFGAYVTMADIAVFESCASHPGIDDSETARFLAALPRRAVDLGVIGAAAPMAIAPVAGKIQSPATALLTALELVDTGMPAAPASAAAFLPPGFLEARLGVARSWASLETSQGQLRLQPRARAGRLAPAPLPGPKRAEALGLADRLIDLATAEPEAVSAWIRSLLAQALMTNAGLLLTSPEAFKAWLAIATRLRPLERWQAERVVPGGADRAALEAWNGVRPPAMSGKTRKIPRGTSVTVRVRLLAPTTPGAGSAVPAASWAGCTRFAAHLAAIWLCVDSLEAGN